MIGPQFWSNPKSPLFISGSALLLSLLALNSMDMPGIHTARHYPQAERNAPRFPCAWPKKTWCRWFRIGSDGPHNVGKLEPIAIRVWIGYHPEIRLSEWDLMVNNKSKYFQILIWELGNIICQFIQFLVKKKSQNYYNTLYLNKKFIIAVSKKRSRNSYFSTVTPVFSKWPGLFFLLLGF